MPILKDQRGVFPLFVLVAIGIAVLVGGGYIIREQFVKTGQSGKSALDDKKIQEQIKNPQTLPSLTPKASAEKTYGQTVTYKPSAKPVSDGSDAVIKEPSFSINPPSGWSRSGVSDSAIKVKFESPEADEDKGENDLLATSNAKIQVSMIRGNGQGNLESLVNLVLKTTESDFESITVNSKTKTTFAGQDAYRMEVTGFRKGVAFNSISYAFIKDNYGILAYGGALKSAWDKRAPDINNSLNSFKLLE